MSPSSPPASRSNGLGIPHKILVAVSDGGLSDAAVEFAGRLAEATGAKLDLLHALPVPTLPGLRLSEKEAGTLETERRALLARELSAYLEGAATPEARAHEW